MKLKSQLIKFFANQVSHKITNWSTNACVDQDNIMNKLISKGKETAFGRDHGYEDISSYEDFKSQVSLRDYEGLRSYIDRIILGEESVLWPGYPKYFAKTSGTTSGVKYIPLTDDSMPNHMNTARNALLNYISTQKDASLFDGKLIFLSGSPILSSKGKIPTGRLSGIVNHEIPFWLKRNQMPTYATNCIEEWEEKLELIVSETLDKNMTLISGIPPWVQMYYERLLTKSGKNTIKEIFPNFNLFMYGGVNFEPYRSQLETLTGARIPSIELYPASEGFIAFQDVQGDQGLLLNTNSGIFFEFVPVSEANDEKPSRLKLDQVELDKDYVIIINNNAGLWAYNLGDCVRFVSLNPYKIIVTGRVKHYISAFGEHVIGKEVEEALLSVANESGIRVIEFTVAPQVNPSDGSIPYHEWFIEFDNEPQDMTAFAKRVDQAMTLQNIYYEDLIRGNILQPLKIRRLKPSTFRDYMKSEGKLGGQNKVPRLSNDRKIADKLIPYIVV